MLLPSGAAANLYKNPCPVQNFVLSSALSTGCQTPCPDVPEFIKAHRFLPFLKADRVQNSLFIRTPSKINCGPNLLGNGVEISWMPEA